MNCVALPIRWSLALAFLALTCATTVNGQALKATRPVHTSPANGAQLSTLRPTLTVMSAVGVWIPATFNHRFRVVSDDDPSMVIANRAIRQGNGLTEFTLPTDLDFDTTYRWSVRAELDGANGPWSTPSTFTTPAAPPPPVGPLGFTDVSAASGVAVPILGGHGAMFADATDDLRPDLYITMNFDAPQAELFFINQGMGMFTEAGAVRGIDDFDVGSHGAAFADLDNDGDYDLLNGATGATGASNNIFLNIGGGFFNDITPPSMGTRTDPTRALLAFDMEGDGDLDVFGVTGWMGSGDPPGERNELYRNDGNLQWTEIASGALYTAPAGQGATDTDYDGDGDVDIIAANRDGDLNVLRNNGTGGFSAVDPDSIGIIHNAFSGITSADVDNDGDLDLLLVGLDGAETIGYLYGNRGGGTFDFVRAFSNIDGYMGGFGDLDNDGDLDLVFAGDDVSYLNNGTGAFSVGPAIPVAGINDPRAIAFADVDADGDLDFAVGAKRSTNRLVRNDNDGGNWLKVRLRSPQGQAGAFGAKVHLFAVDVGNTFLGMRESRSNNGYLGQDDPILHFGLGAQTMVEVVVTFLDGTTRTVSGVASNQTVVVDGTLP
jgi:hypothetical protein